MGVMASEKEAEAGVDFEVELEAIVPNQEGKTGGTGDMPGRSQRPQRTAVVWARAQLEKYRKSCTFEEALADIKTVPASVLFRRKRPAGNDHPTSRKCARTAEAEEQTRPAESQLPLFLPDPEELAYLDQDGQELEDTPQQPADESMNFSPVSLPGTP